MYITGEPRLLSDVSFRDIYGHFLYIECRDVLEDIMPECIADTDTGLCVFGYIDEDAGLSFHPFKIASYQDENLFARDIPGADDNSYILRYHGKYIKQEYHNDFGKVIMATITPSEHTFIDMEDLAVDISNYDDIADKIRTTYAAESPEKEFLRGEEYSYLDPFRYPECPDDVAVIFFRPDVRPERVWVRCKFAAEGEVFGTLMTEPQGEFSFHRGQVIGFVPYEEDGEKYLVATGHTVKTVTTTEEL
jgi:hypothetical protein